jgi:DNA-3-methyladenine glycosylase
VTDARALLSGRATDVAPWLLGARLHSDHGAGRVSVRITEVEAYEGAADPASHAFRGRTARNAVMFGPAGFLYVYFVYGMYWCANVVCGPPGESSALLVRAGEVVDGVDVARSRRPAARSTQDLARGPARLAQCLGLTRADDGLDLLSAASSPVRLTPARNPAAHFERGPRVGVAVAKTEPLRFWLAGDPSVSVYRPGGRIRTGRGRQT